MTGWSDSEFHYGGIGTGAPGVGTAWSGGTGKGTITADVVAAAKDGGLVIRISEKSSADPAHSTDPVLCAVYGATRNNQTTDGTIVYDLAMSLPKSMHEETMMHRSTSSTVQRTIDLELQTDSFAH